MTKPKTPLNLLDSVMSGAGAMPDVGERTRAYWGAQAAAAEHVRAFVEEWWDRRRAAAESAAECCACLTGNGADPGAAAEAWTKFAAGELDRLGADARSQIALAGQLAGDAVSVMSAASKATETEAKAETRRTRHEPAAKGAQAADVR